MKAEFHLKLHYSDEIHVHIRIIYRIHCALINLQYFFFDKFQHFNLVVNLCAENKRVSF